MKTRIKLKDRLQAEYTRGVHDGRVANQNDVNAQMQREIHAQRMDIMRTSTDLVRQAGSSITAIGDVLKAALTGR